MGCESLGEGPVADQETSLDVAFQRLRGEFRGGDEDLLVVVDDGLGMEDGTGGVTRVDGTWVVRRPDGGYQASSA